jgi:hypothetical protein
MKDSYRRPGIIPCLTHIARAVPAPAGAATLGHFMRKCLTGHAEVHLVGSAGLPERRQLPRIQIPIPWSNMMYAKPLSYGKKDEFFRYARSICTRCSRLASSVRDRETVIRPATSSSVITTSSAGRHVAARSDLLKRGIHQHNSSSMDTDSSRPGSWNRSSSTNVRRRGRAR